MRFTLLIILSLLVLIGLSCSEPLEKKNKRLNEDTILSEVMENLKDVSNNLDNGERKINKTEKIDGEKFNVTETIAETGKPQDGEKLNVTETIAETGKPQDGEKLNVNETVEEKGKSDDVGEGIISTKNKFDFDLREDFRESVSTFDSPLISKSEISEKIQFGDKRKNHAEKRSKIRSMNERMSCVGKKFQLKIKQGDRKIRQDLMKFRRNQEIRQSLRYRQMDIARDEGSPEQE